MRQLTAVKGKERFIFRYLPGHESAVIDAFAELAANDSSNFDWSDAALLSYRLGRQLDTEFELAG